MPPASGLTRSLHLTATARGSGRTQLPSALCLRASTSHAATPTPVPQPTPLSLPKDLPAHSQSHHAPAHIPGLATLLKASHATAISTPLQESPQSSQQRKISSASHTRTSFFAKLLSTMHSMLKARLAKGTRKQPDSVHPKAEKMKISSLSVLHGGLPL